MGNWEPDYELIPHDYGEKCVGCEEELKCIVGQCYMCLKTGEHRLAILSYRS